MPCSGRCGERHCPTCCLCCEVLSPHSLLPSSTPYYDVFLKYMLRCIFELFLCFVQVFCCFGPSVSSTRYIIQDEFNIKTTGCDNCIIVSFYLCLAVCVYMFYVCSSFSASNFRYLTSTWPSIFYRDAWSVSNKQHAFVTSLLA